MQSSPIPYPQWFSSNNEELAHQYLTKGYRLGRTWFFYGEAELPLDDGYLLINLEQYCKNGWHHDPEWFAERVGFLVGMVSGQCIPQGDE